MARAKVAEKGLEEIVEEPLGVVLPDIPSSKPYFAGTTISTASAGVPLAGYRLLAVPNDTSGIDWRYAIFGKDLAPYWKFLVRTMDEKPVIRYPGKIPGSYVRSDVLGIIKDAGIDLASCDFESVSYSDASECECYKKDIFGRCIGEKCRLYIIDSEGNRYLAGLSDCAWFEDWSFYRCKLWVWKVRLEGFKCKKFNAEQAMKGTGWEDIAPVYGESATGEPMVIKICPNYQPLAERIGDIWYRYFDVYTLSGDSVSEEPPYILNFTVSPPHGYAG